MYHRIADEAFDPWGLAVSPAHFAAHLEWLAEHRTVLRLQDFADLHRRRALPSDAVAITFDDGYACNAEIAAPLLERFQMPATIFLPVQLIEEGGPFWWDELEQIVLEHEASTLSVDGEEVAIGPRREDDRRWGAGSKARTARQSALQAVHARLVTKAPAEIAKAMKDLRRQAGGSRANASSKAVMDAGQVRRTASGFVEFGSHALTHPWLPALTDAEASREIRDSVERCQALTGVRPSAFAYPFGAFDDRSVRLSEEAGFACACATGDTAVNTNSPLFALRRVQVPDASAAALARRLKML